MCSGAIPCAGGVGTGSCAGSGSASGCRTSAVARRWMPAASLCLHHADGAWGSLCTVTAAVGQVIRGRALTLAGDPGMPIREEFDVALQDDRDGFVDAPA